MKFFSSLMSKDSWIAKVFFLMITLWTKGFRYFYGSMGYKYSKVPSASDDFLFRGKKQQDAQQYHDLFKKQHKTKVKVVQFNDDFYVVYESLKAQQDHDLVLLISQIPSVIITHHYRNKDNYYLHLKAGDTAAVHKLCKLSSLANAPLQIYEFGDGFRYMLIVNNYSRQFFGAKK